MASNWLKKWNLVPAAWLIGTIFMSLSAGICIARNSLWIIFFGLCSLFCATGLLRRVGKIQKRIQYIVEATLSGDFSYKFPITGITGEEREMNEMLNRIVEHFEHLTQEVRQNEVFLGRLINLTEIGLAVADSRGDIRLHNDTALRLLERKALTNVCQIPDEIHSDLEIKKNEVTVNEKRFTLFTITDHSRRMQAVEVESWEKLTRVLTHEIMNSLTPIQSIAETMGSRCETQEASDAFATISSSSRSLMQFVKNFREFSRLPDTRMRVIYLKPLLESCVRMAQSYAEGKVISFSLSCFPPELMVYTDESLLSQVLINIMKNAVEADPTNIFVEADEKADESVEIRISNDGDPIPAEAIPHIFTPFFTTRKKGSGIGLSLSRRIITHLGGTLTFRTCPLPSFSIRL